MPVVVGLSAKLSFRVADVDTALALGSGDVPVLATPRLLAWLEAATVAAVRDELPPGTTSVGAAAELAHLRPSRVGARIDVTARLVAVKGRRLAFEVSADQGGEAVARGRFHRAVVDRAHFLGSPGT